MRTSSRLLAALALALLVLAAGQASPGERPLSINEGPYLAPGIVTSPPGETPRAVELWRISARGDSLLLEVHGPWIGPPVVLRPEGLELRRSYSGMAPRVALYYPAESGQLFFGFVDRQVPLLLPGLYLYRYVFDFTAGRRDTVEAGRLYVGQDGLRFERGGVERYQGRR